jgi:4-hydroxy-tetrahydrodipicolinate synthase
MNLSPQKQWAREHYRGVENSPKTPFTPDFRNLDEEGIRLDVRHCIENGFSSTMLASTYTSIAEKKRFLEVVCDEAKGRIKIGLNLFPHPANEAIELLNFAEKTACTHAFVGVPRNLKIDTEKDVLNYFATICEATSLPLVIYGAPSPKMLNLHPSGFPISLFNKIADLPNIVGMKLTQPIDIALAFELCEVFADRLLIGPANLASVPMIAKNYGVQWIGQWVVEALQSPSKPYLVEFMSLINRNKFSDAMRIYWHLAKAYWYVHNLQESYLHAGTHPWVHINYFHWLTGGNGGLPRKSPRPNEMEATLSAKDRAEIREAYASIGIINEIDPEEQFIVGRTNFSKGVRANEVNSTHCYSE